MAVCDWDAKALERSGVSAVSEGASKCAKAIENLKKLAAKADAVFAFRKDVCSIPLLAWMVCCINCEVNRLIKEEKDDKN